MPDCVPVLLTADESPASLAAARGLHAAGHRVYVAVTRDDTYVARSRTVAGVERLDSEDDPAAYARALAAAAGRLGVALVLPGTERTLRALTGREDFFPPGVAIGTSPPDALEAATDKSTFQLIAARAGLATIPTVEVTVDRLDECSAQLSFPAVAKPLRSVDASRGGRLITREVRLLAGIDDLRGLLHAAPETPWLVQRYLAGSLAAIGGVAWRGELICATHQISPRIWPVDGGVSAYAVSVPPDRAREDAVGRLLRGIGWSGVFGVQFIVSGAHAYAIDLNPRIYGSIALAIAAGQNLPAIWAELLAGGVPSVAPSKPGVRYRVEEDDLRALASAFARGRRREALKGLLPRRRTAHAVFSLRDPRPALATGAKVAALLRTRAGS